MGLAVSVENLSKRYQISQTAEGLFEYRTLREEVVEWAKRPLMMLRGQGWRAKTKPFWALRDVSLQVQSGEVLGIIGRNGAGKSTLLKVLSRITKPTTGQVRMRGRIGSLLEVGTGFHPELTGRENIFLNGAILGMRRREIAGKFDEIVAFSEVEQFLDMPVKRYSSGMYVRLAFAVAAFLEPETLIIDEVLAVGDIGFQRKCLGRMREIGKSGCTVLFVSHNMPAIESLCTRALMLDCGEVAIVGDVRSVINEYQKRCIGGSQQDGIAVSELGGPTRRNRILQTLKMFDEEGNPTQSVRMGGHLTLSIGLRADQTIASPRVTIGINDGYGLRVLTLCTPLTNPVLTKIDGKIELQCSIERLPLAPGDYWIKLGLANPGAEVDEVEQVMRFTVTDCDAFAEGRGFRGGVCAAPSKWRVI